jgi:hypothetical protein
MKKFLLCLLATILFLLPINVSLASTNSPSDYSVTYTIYQNTTAHVGMQVSLVNQEDDTFFSSYNLQLGYSDIKNLVAADSTGSITPTLDKNQKGTTVSLSFNDKIVGIGKKLNFNLSFDTNEVAENRGNVWEINIPGISQKNDFNTFNVKVVYPTSIGKPVYIKPNVPGALSKQNGNTLNFSKDDLGTSGISVAFGNYQIYSFDLSYHLKNSNLFPVRTEIAVPPYTNYQQVILNDMVPKPNNVRLDEDGNWLAEYSLKPSETKNVRVVGKAKVNLNPKEEILTENQKKQDILEKPYWETGNTKIKQLAKELGNPYSIYLFVVKNLTYDYSRVTSKESRIGAKSVLDNPKSAVCLEFTDLFIALCRAAGIPAREINGFAYAKNPEERPLSLFKDILHAWPEYYDEAQKTWIMVDPTWGNTTGGIDYFFNLDVDHLVFVKKGQSSSYPVPAGGYKLSENSNQKDVEVKLDANFEKNEDFEVGANFENHVFSAIPVKGVVKINNLGNSSIENKTINISTGFLTPTLQTIRINKIPPFGYFKNDVSYDKLPFLTNRSDTIKILIDNKTEYIKIQIAPFYLGKKVILGGIIFAISIVILSIIIYFSRRIFVSGPKRKNPLRGEGQKP